PGGPPGLDWPPGPGARIQQPQPDHELRTLISEVDPDRLRATIEKLVSFGTRHTLSSQTDPNRGIGAATQWLFSQMQAIAATSGGRMTTELQSFIQPPASRIPTPTVITNVITTLHGSSSPDRIYLVSGHIDSRVTDVMNFTDDAPGADDGTSDPDHLRLFAEGVPTTETPQQAAIRQSVGGEGDGPSRQLARFVSEVAGKELTGMTVEIIYRRDRYLRGSDHL